MAMFDCLSLIDTYGVNFNILIKSKKTYNTCLTVTFSLITYIIFFIILYFQQEDFIFKTNPNISYIKQDFLTNRDIESSDKYFFPIFFEASSKNFKENIFRHLKTKIALKLRTKDKGVDNYDTTLDLWLIDCGNVAAEDAYFKNELLPLVNESIKNGTTSSCIYGFHFHGLRAYDFENTGLQLVAEFDKCNDGDLGCDWDPAVNQAFESGNINITMRILSAKINLHSYYDSFNYNDIKVQAKIGEIGSTTLYPIKLKNIGDQLFTRENQRVKLSLLSKPIIEETPGKQLIQFNANFHHTVDMYQRQYKTFSANLASTLAVMKVIFWVFTFVSKQYCSGKFNNMFINDNFDHVNSIQPSGVGANLANPPLEGVSNVNLVERVNCRKEGSGFELTFCQLLCFKRKRCFKTKLSKKEQFYKTVVDNILKTLSIENILKRFYEVQKLKYYLLSYEENVLLDNTKTVIDSKSFEHVRDEDKALQFAHFSIINGDYS
jgi:hypothetical protein